MSKLIEIQNQISSLKKQEEELRMQEFKQVVQEIKLKMETYGVTVGDLSFKKNGSAKAKSANPVADKYRGPNGETWTGRGLMPRWLSSLVAEGQTKESFLIAKD